MYGPCAVWLFLPGVVRVWGYHVFFTFCDCFRQYVDYTLTARLGWPRWLAVIAALPLSAIVSSGCRSAKAIPVFRDRRVSQTLDISVKALLAGDSVAVFATRDYQRKSGGGELYSGFLHLEHKVYAVTGRHVPFVPLYACRSKRELIIGAPVYFRDGESVREGKVRVMGELQTQLDRTAGDCGDTVTH
jgi:hypothetical protein